MRHRKMSYGLLGQGLVEYALILLLVVVATILVLTLLGPVIGNVFGDIALDLRGNETNVIVSLTAIRTGGGNGNSIKVDLAVSTATTVTVTDSQSGTSQTVSCNGSCSMTIGSVGNNAGVITVTTAEGGTTTTSYPARQ